MHNQIHREKESYGVRWNSVHEGYFSDLTVAAPLVQKVQEFVCKSKPDTIVDLGGGTGTLLSYLREASGTSGITLVDLDASATQLDAARSAGFSCVQRSVESFKRHDLMLEEKRALFMMRSVLHYFGEEGLRPVLRHLHGQIKTGEFFVHQTASFSCQQDANCLNSIYQMMRTQKWYPTVDFLVKILREEGWSVLEVCPAWPLRLKHDDLTQRYQLDEADIRRICDYGLQTPHLSETVFQSTEAGFCAFLHYWIYVCTPAIS